LLCAVASREQSLDLSDRGGGRRDGIRQILPELLKVLGGHSHDRLLVRSDLDRDPFSPGEHLAGVFERGVRHDVTLVPGASARNPPSWGVALCCCPSVHHDVHRGEGPLVPFSAKGMKAVFGA